MPSRWRIISEAPEFAGTVAAVNTCPFYPLEFDPIGQVIKGTKPESPEHQKALLMRTRAMSDKGFHYHGSAKFFLLAGYAFARNLAGMMAKKPAK